MTIVACPELVEWVVAGIESVAVFCIAFPSVVTTAAAANRVAGGSCVGGTAYPPKMLAKIAATPAKRPAIGLANPRCGIYVFEAPPPRVRTK